MPQRHIDQWKHNRRFLATIAPDFPDWIVTAAFYVALHAFDALLAHDNVIRVVNHAARNDVLLRTNTYSFVRKHYMPLYDLARTVRYMGDPQKWIPFESIPDQVLKRYLFPIERSVQKALNTDLKLPELKLVSPQAAPSPPE